MSVPLTRYKVLLSAPSDAERECELAETIIGRLNRTHSEMTGIELYPMDWRRDSRADSGDEPQALLNKQIVEDSDIILSVFKHRFGTPTKSYGSGTEEEIALGLEMGKQVLVYFWEPSDECQIIDKNEYERICAFRENHSSKGLYKTFKNDEEFEKLIEHDFTSLIFSLERESAIGKAPSLELALVNRKLFGNYSRPIKAAKPYLSQLLNYEALDDYISDDAKTLIDKANERARKEEEERRLQDIWKSQISNSEDTSESIKLKISNMPALDQISKTAAALAASQIDTSKLTASIGSMDIFQAKPVEISDEDKLLIEETLQELGIEYTEGMFELGGLKRDSYSIIGHQASLRGTDEELERCETMMRLIDRSRMRRQVRDFLEDNADVFGIGLCISNSGGSPALHAKVELNLPASFVASADMIGMPDDCLANQMLSNNRDWFDLLFEMSGDANVDDYYDANPGLYMPHLDSKPYLPGPGFGRIPYDADDCRDDLDALIGMYDISLASNGDGYLLKLDFDRVQHGASYAFPCFLLFKDEVPETLDYRIRCDETPKPAEGSVTTKPTE